MVHIEQINDRLSTSIVGAFLISLDNPDDPLDTTVLDENIQQLGRGDKKLVYIKYLVGGDKMLVFGDMTTHARAYSNWSSLLTGELRSAGYGEIFYQNGEEPDRRLYGSSETLAGILDIRESTHYREEVLVPLLDNCFKIRKSRD